MTKSNFIIFLFITSFFNLSIGQEAQGVVIDFDNNPVQQVLVINQTIKDSTFTNEKGEFAIKANWDHSLAFYHPRLKSEIKVLTPDDFSGRPLMVFMEIAEQVQFYEGVTVTGDRIKDVRDVYNENIIDFIPFVNNEILVLTRTVRDKHYNLALLGYDTTYFDFNLNLKRPESFFVDCFKNLHIRTRDSVYQFIFTDTINLISSL